MGCLVVGFGEIMGRLNPPGFSRFRQALPGGIEMTFAGAEANVCASIAMLGGDSRYVTALPRHAIADACVDRLRGLGIDCSCIARTAKGRLGLYFVEKGANQRPSVVIYDREASSIAGAEPSTYDWESVFSGADWLHISGITPALSRAAADSAAAAVAAAKHNGCKVSCDLNFRKKLWNWEPGTDARTLAQRTMRGILVDVDVVIANEEDAHDVLGIQAGHTDVDSGRLEIDKYPAVAREIVKQFPKVSKVAITLRESISASHNNWGAMLFDPGEDKAFFAPMRDGSYVPHEIRAIVDRVGGGDAFAAGLIFALNTPELAESQKAVSFAVAASCLAHSVEGDFNFCGRAEVEALMKGSASGRVQR